MSIEAIGGSTPYATPETAPKATPETAPKATPKAAPKATPETTTVTTHCEKKHAHDRSCPHTVSTRPAPKAGENGYLLDKTV